ncbi:MAG: DUF3450 domain-containing protein [Gammaproteobacteria bacterium]|nr:DUF3450 domain-containing protein [Gammaproteobacteria bacterium]
MLNKKTYRIFSVCLTALLGGLSSTTFAGTLEPSVKVETRIDKAAVTTQKQIDRLAEQTMDLNSEYKTALTRIEQFKAYNARLERTIAEQEKEMESLQNQMNTIDDTERGLMPLMDEMINALVQFVELDVPYKKEERLDTVEGLRTTMLRADVSTSEKYRQILNTYVQEISNGNSVSVYESKMDIDGIEKQVDFLQFGRTALMFATRGDSPKAAIWNKTAKDWSWLNSEQTDAVKKAIKDISLKSKKLIVVPVATPEK